MFALPGWALPAVAPSCGCVQDFDFVVSYLERNLPAYPRDVTAQTRPAYERLKRRLRQGASLQSTPTRCLPILVAYVEFFRDQHTTIAGSAGVAVNDKDSLAVRRFLASAVYQQTETVRLQPVRSYPLAAIEGRYQTTDSTYQIQIQPARTRFRDFVGVVVQSRTPLWAVGQVKLELKQLPHGSRYRIIQYNRNHSASYLGEIRQVQGYLRGTSWQKLGVPAAPPRITDTLAYRALTPATAYLRIPSFNGGLHAQLYSVYQKVAAASPQNLIIDVRGNGGGSDGNVAGLVPFMFTAPFQDDQLEEYYVTPDNVQRLAEHYRGMQRDSVSYGAAALQHVRSTLRWLQQAPIGQFLADPTALLKTFTGVAARPNRVVILYDRGCASSCETLLFWAKHSAKTTLVGENSGGYVGYGNVFSVPTPCLGFVLTSTTMRLPNQVSYEAVGVAPDVPLGLDEDWLTQAKRLIEQP
ncbi:S41 family peptidase [Hymenobacter arizonensis]|uniref:S41 family peptidase n=1 Tax=Hymenobacter arizonensis TaxID=1227077 RepID=UPI0015A5337D|nr:S41 family peptidase [Hymenobacter arizonensis]